MLVQLEETAWNCCEMENAINTKSVLWVEVSKAIKINQGCVLVHGVCSEKYVHCFMNMLITYSKCHLKYKIINTIKYFWGNLSTSINASTYVQVL